MKKISVLILFLYLGVVLNSLAFAQAALTAIPLSGTLIIHGKDLKSSNCDFINRISKDRNFDKFTQDLPQLQDYDWIKAKEETIKLTAFLSKS